MRLVLAHGWGFDQRFWDPLRAALGGPEADADDRGYFGPPRPFAPGAPYVAIGHSLGVLRLLLDRPAGCVGMVAINGFDRFCGPSRVAARVVDRMLARLAVAPADTVRDFRVRCGGGDPIGAPDPDRLRADLLLLRDGDGRDVPPPSLLVLHGDRDPILDAAHRIASFRGRATATLAGGGHLLPLTHPDWCAAHILAHLATL